MKLVYSDSLSSFFTKLSKNNMVGVMEHVRCPLMMGDITGVSDTPHDAPHVII